MKSFLQFISESTAVQQAKRMGLVGDGHGGWSDKQGEFVAKTEGGKLKFYNKRQRQGQDPAQSEKEKNLSAPSSEPAQGKEEPAAPAPIMTTSFWLTLSICQPPFQRDVFLSR